MVVGPGGKPLAKGWIVKGPVTGLGKGTITRYNGIEVGRVTDLQFNPADPQSVIVTLQVQPNLNIR